MLTDEQLIDYFLLGQILQVYGSLQVIYIWVKVSFPRGDWYQVLALILSPQANRIIIDEMKYQINN